MLANDGMVVGLCSTSCFDVLGWGSKKAACGLTLAMPTSCLPAEPPPGASGRVLFRRTEPIQIRSQSRLGGYSAILSLHQHHILEEAA